MSEKSSTQQFYKRIPIEEKIGEQQKGRMKVGAQIIEQLSKGVYSTPEMAIKELVSNAFDADADKVTIDTKSKSGSISILDDGSGMDYKDFDLNYVFISRSPKIGKDEKTPIHKRPMIGKLGIGFLAVSQLCDTMIITSAKRGSNTKFTAILNFGKFKDKQNLNVEFNDISEYVLTNYKKNDLEESYTHIELSNLTKPFEDTLKNIAEPGIKLRRTKKLSYDDFIQKIWHTTKFLQVEKTYGPYWKFMMNLASIIPVEYMKNGPIKIQNLEITKPIKDFTENLKFKVEFDKNELKKPYLLPTPSAKKNGNYDVLPISNKIDLANGSRISYSGYIYSQDGRIDVDDWRGLIVRVKNTSVGIISQNFLDYPFQDTIYFKWTFGEIFIHEGLEEAMNIDRATFKVHDPEYHAFVSDLYQKLQSVVFESVQKRWRSRVKKDAKKKEDYKKTWREKSVKSIFKKNFTFKTDKSLKKPISVSLKQSTVSFNPENKILNNFPRKEREFLKDVIFAVTISREKYPTNSKKQEELFLQLLENLARNYPKLGLKFEYKRLKK